MLLVLNVYVEGCSHRAVGCNRLCNFRAITWGHVIAVIWRAITFFFVIVFVIICVIFENYSGFFAKNDYM